MIKRLVVIILGVFAFSLLYAENIRVSVPYSVTISSADIDGETFKIKYNEAVGIQIASDDMFLQGIEIEIKMSKEMLPYISALGWTIYGKVTPAFSKKRFDYEGSQIFFQPLPERISLVLQIPVDKNHTLKTSPFATVLPFIATPDKLPLLFGFFMLGKGVNSAIEKGYFTVTVKPILKNEGLLAISFTPSTVDIKNVNVFIDDNKILLSDRLIYLKKGTYTVRVSAEGYREEIYTINILPAQTTTLQVSLNSAIPLLVFALPENTIVLINGKAVDWSSGSYELEPGEYTLTIKIGDYVISRKVTFTAGKKYTISIEMNLIIDTHP